MHRFLINPETACEGVAPLSAEESRHALRVLRLKDGDAVEAIDGRGNARRGRLVVTPEGASIELGEYLESTESPHRFPNYMGLPTGEKLELIAQKLTEIGACRLVPVRMERCIAKIAPGEAEKKLQRVRRISKEAQKQSGRQSEMEIADPIDFGLLPNALKAHEASFLLWEKASGARLWDEKAKRPWLKDVACVVGPEGGISESEAEALVSAGAIAVTLGPRILRAETAAIVCAAEAMALWGDL